MKTFVLIISFLVIITSCAQKREPLLGETTFQKNLNLEFRDATKSPLTATDRKTFKALDFFKFDSNYVVTATFLKVKNATPFAMKTTTKRTPMYVTYGIASFNLNGKSHQLKLYQNISLSSKEAYKDYLFLPFLDKTNGKESYIAGRYIECSIPEGDKIIIDFNTAYNPYCAYNHKYSCPIVPSENYLDTEIKAGVKAYKKH